MIQLLRYEATKKVFHDLSSIEWVLIDGDCLVPSKDREKGTQQEFIEMDNNFLTGQGEALALCCASR